MKLSKSSKAWIREHINDPYVQRAKKEGYRSRAAYKLLEIDARDKLLRPGQVVVDLGATPGGWSQIAARRIQPGGKLVAIDLLELEPLPNCEFVCADFREQAGLDKLMLALAGRRVDLVLSDMAPNISGIESADQARGIELAELALEFSNTVLQPGGAFLVKVFQGAGFESFHRAMRGVFARVMTRKPDASRSRSAEVYLLGKGFIAPTRPDPLLEG